MNTIGFVAICIVLAFAIGFTVAAIIWLLCWLMQPKDQREKLFGFLKVFKSNKQSDLSETV